MPSRLNDSLFVAVESAYAFSLLHPRCSLAPLCPIECQSPPEYDASTNLFLSDLQQYNSACSPLQLSALPSWPPLSPASLMLPRSSTLAARKQWPWSVAPKTAANSPRVQTFTLRRFISKTRALPAKSLVSLETMPPARVKAIGKSRPALLAPLASPPRPRLPLASPSSAPRRKPPSRRSKTLVVIPTRSSQTST